MTPAQAQDVADRVRREAGVIGIWLNPRASADLRRLILEALTPFITRDAAPSEPAGAGEP